MTAITVYSKSSRAKINRTVKQVGTTPHRSATQDRRRIGGQQGGKSTQFTFLAKIKTYTAGTGIYTVDIYGNGYGELPTQENVNATPTITTFTPLGIGEKAIVMLDVVETLGDNEN